MLLVTAVSSGGRARSEARVQRTVVDAWSGSGVNRPAGTGPPCLGQSPGTAGSSSPSRRWRLMPPGVAGPRLMPSAAPRAPPLELSPWRSVIPSFVCDFNLNSAFNLESCFRVSLRFWKNSLPSVPTETPQTKVLLPALPPARGWSARRPLRSFQSHAPGALQGPGSGPAAGRGSRGPA